MVKLRWYADLRQHHPYEPRQLMLISYIRMTSERYDGPEIRITSEYYSSRIKLDTTKQPAVREEILHFRSWRYISHSLEMLFDELLKDTP